MKLLKFTFLFFGIVWLNSCASGYKMINPKSINYTSSDAKEGVILKYKYNLLDKKYAKKEVKKGIRLVAITLTNNTANDLVFGNDIKLSYENGSELYVMENERVFKELKQSSATYLLYLLLSPLNLYTATTSSDGTPQETSSTPIGLVLGPGLAGGNMIAAGSANKKFETEMLTYNINGTTIKSGETVYGLIGIKSDHFDAIKIKM